MKNERNLTHAQILNNESFSYILLYQGYDPRSRLTDNLFFFSAYVYISDVYANIINIIWEIEKAYLFIENYPLIISLNLQKTH